MKIQTVVPFSHPKVGGASSYGRSSFKNVPSIRSVVVQSGTLMRHVSHPNPAVQKHQRLAASRGARCSRERGYTWTDDIG